jgi:general secretion pathway protein N
MDVFSKAGGFRASYMVFGLAFFLLFVISSAPAWLVGWALEKTINNQIVIKQPTGSLWSGKAAGLQASIPAAPPIKIDLNNVTWSLQALRLLQGELALRVTIDDKPLKFNGIAGFGFGATTLRDAKAEVSPQWLQEMIPALAFVKPDGKLLIATDDFKLQKNIPSGKAQLEWRGAAVSLSSVNPLGDYRADLDAKGDTADFNVTTLSGPLKVNGKGGWSAKLGPRFSGTAVAEPAQAANIDPLLRLMGKPAASGGYALEFPPKPSTSL